MNNSNSLWILILALFLCMFPVQWCDVTSAEISSEESEDEQLAEQAVKKKYISSEGELEVRLDSDEYDLYADNDNLNWDIIIFTQQWPVTLCYHWREDDKNHSCELPTTKEFWTIHGIWPTKLGHFGPNFCNNSAHFDIKQLIQIEKSLVHYWPDIAGTNNDDVNWLWKHEWLKHGTCAALLESLNNERKYFEQGIEWREIYNISHIFDLSNILPDSVNTVITLQTALLKILGKNPSIHCVYDHKHNVNYLSEIRICFNKQLQLIDCDGVQFDDAVVAKYPGGNVITNCHISQPVFYPSRVPPVSHRSYVHRNHQWRHSLVNFYKLLQFIMWATL